MRHYKTIFESCSPWSYVLSENPENKRFAASLKQMILGNLLDDYCDPDAFFRYTYPTQGLKALLSAICQRLSDRSINTTSIVGLYTRYGWGKTHAIIALAHAIRNWHRVTNITDFVPFSLIPRDEVRIVYFDDDYGSANGTNQEYGFPINSLWGELAYQLGGITSFTKIMYNDHQHTTPSLSLFRDLLKDKPTLILLDALSAYLRRAEKLYPGAGEHIASYIKGLFEIVDSEQCSAIVYTLPIEERDGSKDDYRLENLRILDMVTDAKSALKCKALCLKPVDVSDLPMILTRRLFEKIDADWLINLTSANNVSFDHPIFHQLMIDPESRNRISQTYPFHPETLRQLMQMSALSEKFYGIRSMLRILSDSTKMLWEKKPPNKLFIGPLDIEYSREIARIAYRYWIDRNFQDGSPEEDWFRAEREFYGK
jgi:predicted AAA+ superfamily ATPase